MNSEAYAERQKQLSKDNKAEGQCMYCHAFTLDGSPPTAHRSGCRFQDDDTSLVRTNVRIRP